jgi:hypothetical protein
MCSESAAVRRDLPMPGSSVEEVTLLRTRPWACRRLAHANSSSSAFASFRSGVSKPSMNEP